MHNTSLPRLAGILVLAMALVVIPVSCSPVTISIADVKGSAGSEIIVPVTIQDSAGIGAILIDINYGNHVMSYVSTEPGTLKPDAIVEAREVNPGVVEVGVLDSKGISGSGTLALLKFRGSDNVAGSSSLIPAVIEAYDITRKPIDIGSKGGKVTISDSQNTGSPASPAATGSPSKTPLEPYMALAAIVVSIAGLHLRKEK